MGRRSSPTTAGARSSPPRTLPRSFASSETPSGVQAPGHALARAAGEPEWLTDPGTLTYGRRYEYDRSSELVAVWDRHRGPTRYEYDRVGQLLASLPSNDNTEATSSGAPPPASAPAPASEERFSYDAAGNLYDAAGREYDAGNQLLRRGNVDYCWNADGQLWEKHRHTPFGVEVTRYLWNDAGQLRTVELPRRPNIPGTGPGVLTSAFPRHKNR